MSEHVVVFVDGPNADNQAAAWGAYQAFDGDISVVVSATAVNYQPNAPLGSRDINASRYAHMLHTARMAGLFKRAGTDVPVFSGLDIAHTAITSPIPHSAHVRHEDYDIFDDMNGLGRRAIAGNFDDALTHIEGLNRLTHVVVGGPFSEIPRLLEKERIVRHLGYLAAQAGFALSTRAIYSKLAFNVDVDMEAALQTLLYYPGTMLNVPSDITRHPSVTFSSAKELVQMGIQPELGKVFLRHRAQAEERHKEEQRRREAEGGELKSYPPLSIHDLQAVLALRQGRGFERDLFQFSHIEVAEAVDNMRRASQLRERDGFPPTITEETIRELGYRGLNATIQGEIPPRYVVTGQDSSLYKQRVAQLLQP